MVGARGFEPPTTCTPCRCATRLRYAPNSETSYSIGKTGTMDGDRSAFENLQQFFQLTAHLSNDLLALADIFFGFFTR